MNRISIRKHTNGYSCPQTTELNEIFGGHLNRAVCLPEEPERREMQKKKKTIYMTNIPHIKCFLQTKPSFVRMYIGVLMCL